MAKRKWTWALISLLLLAGLCSGGILAYDHGRPLPVPARERLFDGVDYARKVRWSPRPMVIHVITIDMHTNETVEKVILNDPILLSTGIQHAVKEWLSSSLPGFLSLSRPIMVDFTNIVYQGK